MYIHLNVCKQMTIVNRIISVRLKYLKSFNGVQKNKNKNMSSGKMLFAKYINKSHIQYMI